MLPELALPSGADGRGNVAVVELGDTQPSREFALLSAPALDDSVVELIARTAGADHVRARL